MKLLLTLTVGASKYEEILVVPEKEWDSCKTDEERDALRFEYWTIWATAHMAGTTEIVEEYH